MNDDWELTHSVKINPWARAMWERKHPEGPVLVVWQLWPLPDYVAGWIPFAGRKCIPALVSAAHVEESVLIDSIVTQLGEEAFLSGPSAKMIQHAKSIAASYAENGKKGGRPGRNARRSKASKEMTDDRPDDKPLSIERGPLVNRNEWHWSELAGSARPGKIWTLKWIKNSYEAALHIDAGEAPDLFNLARGWRANPSLSFTNENLLKNATFERCFAVIEAIARMPPSLWNKGDAKSVTKAV